MTTPRAPHTDDTPTYTSVLVDQAYTTRCPDCGGSGFELALNGHVVGVCWGCSGTGILP